MRDRTTVLGVATVVSGGSEKISEVQWRPELTDAFSIERVPDGKKLVLTDILITPQKGSADHVINIVELTSPEGYSIILQCYVHSGTTAQVHLHTGYTFGPGITVGIGTDANAPLGQFYNAWLYGYVENIIPSALQM